MAARLREYHARTTGKEDAFLPNCEPFFYPGQELGEALGFLVDRIIMYIIFGIDRLICKIGPCRAKS